jgi:hypothetical protein
MQEAAILLREAQAGSREKLRPRLQFDFGGRFIEQTKARMRQRDTSKEPMELFAGGRVLLL